MYLVFTHTYELNQSGDGPYHSKHLKPDFVSIVQNLDSHFLPIRPLRLVHLCSAAYLKKKEKKKKRKKKRKEK